MHIIHLADIHIGSSPNRVEEYEQIFAAVRDRIVELQLRDVVFVIAGDIFHHKIKYCGDDVRLFELLINSTFGEKVIIIPGNHDGNVDNCDTSVDLVTPLVSKYTNVTYMRDSGVYSFGGYNFVHLSVYDKSKSASTWLSTQAFNYAELKCKGIFLYHGFVNGARFGTHVVNDSRVTKDVLNKFRIALLGDIHEKQFVTSTAAYSGSLIQQNLGDGFEKGFLVWNVEEAKGTFERIQNSWGYLRFDLRGKTEEEAIREINSSIRDCPQNLRKVSIITDSDNDAVQVQVRAIRDKYGRIDVINQSRKEINVSSTVRETLSRILDNKGATVEQREEILNSHMNTMINHNCSKWTLVSMTWENLYKYRGENTINFDARSNVISGVIAKNRSGKSSILDILIFALYNEVPRGSKKFIIHSGAKTAYCEVKIRAGDTCYVVRRDETSTTSKVSLFSQHVTSNEQTVLTSTTILKTYELLSGIVGSLSQFLSTGMYNSKLHDIVEMSKTERIKRIPEIMGLTNLDDVSKSLLSKLRAMKLELNKMPKPKHMNARELHDACILKLASMESRLSVVKNEIDDLREQHDKMKESVGRSQKLEVALRKLHELEDVFDSTDLSPYEVARPSSNYDDVVRIASTVVASNELEIVKRLEALQREVPYDYEPRNYASEVAAQERAISDLEAQISRLRASPLEDVSKLTSDIDNYPQFIHGLEFDNSCSKCINNRGKIDESSLENNLKGLELLKNRLKRAREAERSHMEADKLDNKVVGLRAKLDWSRSMKSVEEKYSEVQRLKQGRVDVAAVEQAKSEVVKWKGYHGYLKSLKMTPIKGQMDTLTIQISELRDQLRDVDITKKDDVFKRMSDAIAEHMKLESAIALENANDEVYLKDIETLCSTDGRLETLLDEIDTIELYIDALGTGGLMLQIVDTHMDNIISKVNIILQTISNFKIKAQISNTKLDLFIVENDYQYPIAMGSGYQCFIVSLIIRFVLTDTLFTAPEFIFIDEGFGCIDEENMLLVIDALNSMKDMFKFIFIISHIDLLQNVIECPLYISNKGSYSVIGDEAEGREIVQSTPLSRAVSKETYVCGCSTKPMLVDNTKKHEQSMRHKIWLARRIVS